MSEYEPLDATEAATLNAQPQLGEGYESKCLPGWIESFGRWFREGGTKELSPGMVENICHTLIAARRRNWLMADEIRTQKKLLRELLIWAENWALPMESDPEWNDFLGEVGDIVKEADDE